MLPSNLLLSQNSSRYRNLSAGVTGSIVKALPGQIMNIFVSNIDTKFVVLKIYNKATAPTSSDTPIATFPINTVTQSFLDFSSEPIVCAAGISIRASGAVADADTTATTASTCVVFMEYK
jgi:hypothetical protein